MWTQRMGHDSDGIASKGELINIQPDQPQQALQVPTQSHKEIFIYFC